MSRVQDSFAFWVFVSVTWAFAVGLACGQTQSAWPLLTMLPAGYFLLHPRRHVRFSLPMRIVRVVSVILGAGLSWIAALVTGSMMAGFDWSNSDIPLGAALVLIFLFWVMPAVVLGPITAEAWRRLLRIGRFPAGHCAACGYDLSGLTGTICPECGRDRAQRNV